MTTHVVTNVHARLATGTRPPRGPLVLSRSERIRLALALGCALTGTALGAAMALVVLVLVLARRTADRALERSVAARRGVLPPAQDARALHSTGHRREATARP